MKWKTTTTTNIYHIKCTILSKQSNYYLKTYIIYAAIVLPTIIHYTLTNFFFFLFAFSFFILPNWKKKNCAQPTLHRMHCLPSSLSFTLLLMPPSNYCATSQRAFSVVVVFCVFRFNGYMHTCKLVYIICLRSA